MVVEDPDADPGQNTAIPAPVSSAYCEPHEVQFVLQKVDNIFSDRRFKIRDPQGSFLFDVQRGKGFFTKRRSFCDASGKTVVILRKENFTMHYRWRAYRDESESESDLLFTMARTSICQFKPEYEIFLPENQSSRPDFIVKGGFWEKTFTIFHNGTVIAEANKEWKLTCCNVKFFVRINPQVDQVFIASLLVIISSRPKGGASGGAGGIS